MHTMNLQTVLSGVLIKTHNERGLRLCSLQRMVLIVSLAVRPI